MADEQAARTEADGKSERSYTPAYIPIQSFLSFVESLDPKAMPRSIDRSMMPNYSGGVQKKLMSALTFLGLIRPGGEITDQFCKLVEAKADSEQYKAVLGHTIAAAYAAIVRNLDVGTATAKQLTDAFREGGVDGTTLHEAIRFYVKARQTAGLPVSKYISDGKIGTLATKTADKNGSKPRNVKRTLPPAQGDREEVHCKPNPSSEQHPPTPPGMIRIPIHVPGKPEGVVIVHDDLNEADCAMIGAFLQAYAKRVKETKQDG
jgi:hypothetical protein